MGRRGSQEAAENPRTGDRSLWRDTGKQQRKTFWTLILPQHIPNPEPPSAPVVPKASPNPTWSSKGSFLATISLATHRMYASLPTWWLCKERGSQAPDKCACLPIDGELGQAGPRTACVVPLRLSLVHGTMQGLRK